MIYQHNAQRTQRHTFPNGRIVRVGTIPIGEIVYIQDGLRPLSGKRDPFTYRNPWIVEAWHNREYFPAVQGARDRIWMSGGHLATVRSLRDGRRQLVADWILRMSLGE